MNVTGPDEIREMIFVYFSAIFCSLETACGWKTRGIKLGRIRMAVAAADNNNNDNNMTTNTRPTISYDRMISRCIVFYVSAPIYIANATRHCIVTTTFRYNNNNNISVVVLTTRCPENRAELDVSEFPNTTSSSL